MEQSYRKNLEQKYFMPLFILIMTANLIECYIIMFKHHFKNKFEYQLVSLSIADFMTGLFGFIFSVIDATKVKLNEKILDGLQYILLFSIAMSIFLISGISIDRLIAVTKPFNHQSSRNTIYIITSLWVFGLLYITSLMIINEYFLEQATVATNTIVLTSATVVSIISYTLIYFSLWYHKRILLKQTEPRTKNITSGRNFNKMALRMSVIIILSTLLTYWPGVIISFSKILFKCSTPTVEIFSNFTFFLTCSASLINPLVYFFYKRFI